MKNPKIIKVCSGLSEFKMKPFTTKESHELEIQEMKIKTADKLYCVGNPNELYRFIGLSRIDGFPMFAEVEVVNIVQYIPNIEYQKFD